MRRRGFTLLETLVALALTALVLAALYGAVGRAVAARARTTERAEQLSLARTTLVRMTHELEAAVAPSDPGGPERFVVVQPGTSPWSELRFARADTELVAYGVREEPPGRGALVRRAASRFAAPDAGEPTGAPVLPGVVRFGIRCWDGGEWRAAWDAPVLPRAVEITLGLADGAGGVELLATTVALPLAGS